MDWHGQTLSVYSFIVFRGQFQIELSVQPNIHSVSDKNVMVVDMNIFNCWVSLSVSSVSVQSNLLRNIFRHSVWSFWFNFSQFIAFFGDSCSYRSMRFNCTRIAGCGKPECVICCSGLFVCSENSFKWAVMSRSPSGNILGVAVSTGLMNSACSGLTTETLAICVFLLTVRHKHILLF